jgi:hypothetical protein
MRASKFSDASKSTLAAKESMRRCQGAIDSIMQSRQHIEKLLADVDRDEHYKLSLLGPILANLKEAESQLRQLRDNA